MKTKMKTILSVCMLTALLYACTKSDTGPLDCMDVENGLAVFDECGNCHQSYVYDYVSHMPTYINDTTGLVLGATEMFVLAGSDDHINNPYSQWNGGPLTVIDDSSCCHQSYIYDYVSHVQTYIDDTTGLVLGATEMLVLAGSDDYINNPYSTWNTGCE